MERRYVNDTEELEKDTMDILHSLAKRFEEDYMNIVILCAHLYHDDRRGWLNSLEHELGCTLRKDINVQLRKVEQQYFTSEEQVGYKGAIELGVEELVGVRDTQIVPTLKTIMDGAKARYNPRNRHESVGISNCYHQNVTPILETVHAKEDNDKWKITDFNWGGDDGE